MILKNIYEPQIFVTKYTVNFGILFDHCVCVRNDIYVVVTQGALLIGVFVFHYVSDRMDFYVFVNALSVHYIHCERRTIARSKVSKPLLTGGHGVA